MNKYEKYKASGIEWMGDMPDHWRKLKIGRSFKQIGSGTTPKSGSDAYYEDGEINWLNTGDLNDSYITETKKKITAAALNEFSTLKIYPINSIVIALYGATIGKLGQLQIETTTNQACCVLSDSDDIENRYLLYFLLSAREYIISRAYGGGQPNISQDLIKQLYIAAPAKNEQGQIVQYLDHQTAIIDQLIQQKEKLIELLKEKRQAVINEAVTKGLNPNAKMKESGIEWLGKVPEEWIESRIKFVANIQGRVGYKGYTKEDIVAEGEGALTLGAKHIDKENNLDLKSPEYIKWEKYEESPEIMVKMDDIIFTQRGSLGKVCHINSDIGKATINPSMVILSPISIYPRFLYYWLSSNRIQNEVEVLQSNTAVPMISQFQLSNFPILLPPLQEQMDIVKSIDEKLLAFRSMFQLSNNQIEKLEEFRQSIISEAVTGKIDVREWQPNKQQVA